MGEQTPFRTNNAMLAQTLRDAGVPFADDTKPCQTEYNGKGLGDMGFPQTFDGAIQAFKAKKKPKDSTDYFFQRTPELADIISGFDEAQKALEQNQNLDVDCSIKDFAKIYCWALKRRRGFLEIWSDNLSYAIFMISGAIKKGVVSEGGKKSDRLTMRGAKWLSLNGSPESRAHLKL